MKTSPTNDFSSQITTKHTAGTHAWQSPLSTIDKQTKLLFSFQARSGRNLFGWNMAGWLLLFFQPHPKFSIKSFDSFHISIDGQRLRIDVFIHLAFGGLWRMKYSHLWDGKM
jgi:hypothetical protein